MRHRHRIQHADEDADEGADMIVPTGYRDRWCGLCGQHQIAEGWDRCVMCNRPLGQNGWICECGHRNPDGSDECESCGAGA